MRFSVWRQTAARISTAHSVSGLFSPVNERVLLENILLSPKLPRTYDFVQVRDEVAAQEQRRTNAVVQRRREQQLLKTRAEFAEPSEAALELMTRPAITTREISHFLSTHYLSGTPRFERRARIHAGMMDLLSASSANNLRSLMQFLALYWQIGVAETRPLIFDARTQARMVLLKSMELHPETQFNNGGEQLGVPDFAKFTQFVSNFFKYMGVPDVANDELYDLLLRLQARSGSLKAATTEVISRRAEVDGETMQLFLNTLARSQPDPAVLQSVRPLLIREDLGASAVRFLLPLLTSQADLMSLLELVDQSCWRDEIYEQSQGKVIETVLRVADSPVMGLAQMFGVLHRIKKRVPVNQSSLDVATAFAREQKNESAVRILESF